MVIAGRFSFKGGSEAIAAACPNLMTEIENVIAGVNASQHVTKASKEKTMAGKMLYSPTSLNKAFKAGFAALGWEGVKVKCSYSEAYYVGGYTAPPKRSRERDPYREMDFLKGDVGVEVQFGKYAFMVYNVCAKMTIFSKLNHIKFGVEIVPMKSFARGLEKRMSTGVSYFEQIVWDLEHRGCADIDIPVVVIGIT